MSQDSISASGVPVEYARVITEVIRLPSANINGLNHYYEDLGNGAPLVMFHGAGSSSVSLSQHFDDLAGDHRLVVPDMRAMGRSDHVDSIPPSAWVDDLVGLLDHLGIESTVLYGVSLGSRVAMRFAIDYPERVRALIVDGPIIAQDQAGHAATAQVFNVDSYSAERRTDMQRLHGDGWEQVARNYLNIRNEPALQEYFNLRNTFAQIECPVLILRGDKDDGNHKLIYTYELLQGLQDARLAIVPGIGFNVGSGRPELFRQLLRDFLEAAIEVSE